DEVMVLPELDFHKFQPDVELAALLAVIESLQPARIFMPDNLIGDGDLGRRLIAHSQRTAATQVVEIDAKHVASYQTGSSVLAIRNLPEIVLLAANAVDTDLPFCANAKRLDAIELNHASDEYQDLGLQTASGTEIALEEADFIVSAGNGVQNLSTLQSLALQLDAAIGASRVVVDNGKLPRDKQIGATGKTVSATSYLAIGISGAVQHLQGIKDCRHVIAINRDSSAPIIKRADLSVIGDAEEIMQALIVEIGKAKEIA
ncbi:MAG: electron transfer flavoprotein subunit alpha/FixB family protein, partial [Methylophilales bacterium]|nr:electron transfer flavoprotein subunit alpha/FixB family protein [Methylophilales bacterium]